MRCCWILSLLLWHHWKQALDLFPKHCPLNNLTSAKRSALNYHLMLIKYIHIPKERRIKNESFPTVQVLFSCYVLWVVWINKFPWGLDGLAYIYSQVGQSFCGLIDKLTLAHLHLNANYFWQDDIWLETVLILIFKTPFVPEKLFTT